MVAKLFASLKKWWPAISRLPFSLQKKPAKSWRAKQFSLNLTPSRELIVTLRRFKTAKRNRAKAFKQTVVPLHFLPGRIREVAIRQKRHRVRKNHTFSLRRAIPASLVMAGLIGTVFFGAQLVRAEAPPAPATVAALPATETDKKTEGLPASTPTHLKIPALNVNADILTVGRDESGAMKTPPLYSHAAGWYKYSPTPGEIGPAIITGHVDSAKEGPSVFWGLGELKPGDEIKIAREDGKTVTFRVNTVKQFSQQDFPTEEVYGNIDHAGLRLITCGGNFDYLSRQYSHNTVVFASVLSST